ncbi:hypothetical protein N8482_03245 [Chitinophagales bacterium]|nr:hypothetical protein [Chitinophagales bacterium]
MSEAIKFRNLLEDAIVKKKHKLDLSKVDFIEPRNCNLIFGIFESDEGIFTEDEKTFYCALTLDGYKEMLELMEPFCKKETKGHQYLYDIDSLTDFLFSPAGTW